ncbi:MAG: hypothetical protein AAGF89_16030 [Bacteroidota bacterium]
MRFLTLLLCCFVLALVACEKSTDNPKLTDCDEAILKQLNFSAFSGTIPNDECGFHLDKYRFTDGEFYYRPDDNCADLVNQYFNCKGENICDNNGTCPGSSGAEFVRIIGKND